MLKLALSLAALLALVSPAIAQKTECIAPTTFEAAVRVEGADLIKFREMSKNLPEQTDLVLLLKNTDIAVAFVKGCAVVVGHLYPASPEPVAPKLDDGKI